MTGKTGFMSPEQASGHAAGPPSDIFSLGAALAFAATGREPFGAGAAAELVYRVVHAAPSLDGVTGRLRALIESCLAKDPGQRPGTDDLLAAAATTTPSSRAVVEAYFTAINQRDWLRVWRLGGRNLGVPYNKMIAGFQDTRQDVITSITTDAATVSVRFLAYETTSAVQTYAARYTVRAGVIISGNQTLTGTRYLSASAAPPANCPHITYGADGNAGPLFCSDGRPNPPVLAYFQQMHLRVLQLGTNAAPSQVLQAMCADLGQHSTYPIETSELAQRASTGRHFPVRWRYGREFLYRLNRKGCDSPRSLRPQLKCRRLIWSPVIPRIVRMRTGSGGTLCR